MFVGPESVFAEVDSQAICVTERYCEALAWLPIPTVRNWSSRITDALYSDEHAFWSRKWTKRRLRVIKRKRSK